MTQVSSAVDVLWNLYLEHPEKLSKVDWEYLIRSMADALAREILIKDMHEHMKPVQDKHEQQWRTANQATLQRIGQCVAGGGMVAYMDLIAAIDTGLGAEDDIYNRQKRGAKETSRGVTVGCSIFLAETKGLYILTAVAAGPFRYVRFKPRRSDSFSPTDAPNPATALRCVRPHFFIRIKNAPNGAYFLFWRSINIVRFITY